MNLDDFILQAENIDDYVFGHELASKILRWKENEATVLELQKIVEDIFLKYDAEYITNYQLLYKEWVLFKKNAIKMIGGMTMNERLYYFSLFDRYDGLTGDDVDIIYRKLLARR